MVESTFEIDDEDIDELGKLPDTFLDMRGWHKGIVFINGFNIGRYFRVGPQQTLYVPGPLLRKGKNTVCIFLLERDSNKFKFMHILLLNGFKIRIHHWNTHYR